MKTRAAVAFEAGQPLEITELDLAGPQAGEVLVEIKATGICHTDEFTFQEQILKGCFLLCWDTKGQALCVKSGLGSPQLVWMTM